MFLTGQPGNRKVRQDSAKFAKETESSSSDTFVPVDAARHFVLMCDYTGKEVV
jgi:hypothetical protein